LVAEASTRPEGSYVMVTNCPAMGTAGLMLTPLLKTAALQSRMAVLQLAPPLLSVMVPATFWNQTIALVVFDDMAFVKDQISLPPLIVSAVQFVPPSKLICWTTGLTPSRSPPAALYVTVRGAQSRGSDEKLTLDPPSPSSSTQTCWMSDLDVLPRASVDSM